MDVEKEINAVLQQSVSDVSEDHMKVIRQLLDRNVGDGSGPVGWLLWAAVLIFQYGMICGKREERKRRRKGSLEKCNGSKTVSSCG